MVKWDKHSAISYTLAACYPSDIENSTQRTAPRRTFPTRGALSGKDGRLAEGMDFFAVLCYNTQHIVGPSHGQGEPATRRMLLTQRMRVETLKIPVLGVAFDDLRPEEAIARGAELAKGDDFHYVVTPNPEIVNLARDDEHYRTLLNGAALVLPDGIGILYAARILGHPLTARIPGIDFAAGLMEALARDKGKLFLLGAKPGIADLAAQNLRVRYPGLDICGTHDGYFQNDEAVLSLLRAARADVVFVCLGAPRQERWMAEFGPRSGATLMLGLGGALDVFSGTVQRAPPLFQKLGLEWFYRLLHQPSRIGRMAKLPLFLVTAWRQRGKGEV